MFNKILLLYSWFVFLILSWLPDQPLIMRFRGWLLSFGMKSCGKNFQVSSTVIIRGLQNLSVGNDVYLAPRVIINAIDSIQIHHEVMIAFNSVIVSGNHTFVAGSYRFGSSAKQPITIKRGVWVAANSTVTAGCVIGEGSILAANSVGKGELDKASLYAGVPAKKIKSF
ncbi:MAG: acyltransferase [Campylobacterales bacterium]|nr:acyltransferase [Campylobacterales bacterium]